MASRGLSELRKHFERDHHLRADQRYREKYFPRAVLGKNALVLVGQKLEEVREKYKNFEVPELDQKRPYYHDVADGKTFTFTTQTHRTGFQLHLLMTLLRSGGELWGLEEYWTQVRVLARNSAQTSDFSRNPKRIRVNILI